jgi:hypothetical protein
MAGHDDSSGGGLRGAHRRVPQPNLVLGKTHRRYVPVDLRQAGSADPPRPAKGVEPSRGADVRDPRRIPEANQGAAIEKLHVAIRVESKPVDEALVVRNEGPQVDAGFGYEVEKAGACSMEGFDRSLHAVEHGDFSRRVDLRGFDLVRAPDKPARDSDYRQRPVGGRGCEAPGFPLRKHGIARASLPRGKLRAGEQEKRRAKS